MNYKDHLLGYTGMTLFLLIYLPKPEIPTLLAGFFIGAVYALLPDIDSQSSKINNIVETLLALGFVLTVLKISEWGSLPALTLAVIMITIQLLKHRGWMHKLSTGAVLSLPWYMLNPAVGVFAFWGFITHLLLDMVKGK